MYVATRLLLYQTSMISTKVSSSFVPLTNEQNRIQGVKQLIWFISRHFHVAQFDILVVRSEERRVGKECW